MKRFFKNKLQLTDEGAKGLIKSSISCFVVYIINMFPVMLIMFLGDMLILNNKHDKFIYLGLSIATLLLLLITLFIEYENLYNATYKEVSNLRIGISRKLKSLPLSYFSKKNLSDLSQTIMKDVETMEHALSHSLPKVFALIVFIPIVGILLVIGNYQLGLAIIIPNLLRFIIILIYKKSTIKTNQKFYNITRDNSEQFQEIIEMSREIKGLNLGKKSKENLYKQMEYSEKQHLKAEFQNFKIMFLSTLISYVSIGIVLVIGTNLLLKGSINVLILIGYILSTIKIKELIDISNESILEILYIFSSVKRIKEINTQTLQKGEDVELKKFDIELKNLKFSYQDDVEILKDVSFTAKQGEVTALVGPSGCGKTTLLKLISRLYDYDEGSCLIDNKDIKEISTDSLFDKTSIVFQDVTLFNNSILENIRIGNLNASDEEVINAAKLANCMDFIDKLPDGINTFIGENGAELSGGERQRISIARAFLKDAPILILDEIASSLDSENESKIQQSLNKLIKNKTVIVISHRLKSIENVDKIIVLNNGKVETFGTHKELIEKSKTYNNLISKTKSAEEFIY